MWIQRMPAASMMSGRGDVDGRHGGDGHRAVGAARSRQRAREGEVRHVPS
jgi:hypothetical protein